MQIEIGIVELLGFLVTLITAFWALLSMLFKQSQNQIADRFTALEKSTSEKFAALEESAKELARIEKEFLIFQRDLPLYYVRREDYVRNQSVIESKLDALALKLENWQLKEVVKHDQR